MRDREALEATSLGELTTFVEGDGKRLRLADTFPLIAVAASQEGENELKTILQQIYRLSTIPELPVVRVDEASPETAPLLVTQLLESSLDRLVGHVSKVHTELAMLRRERETMFENYRAIEDAFHARNWDSSTEIFSHALWSIQRMRALRACCANRRSNSFFRFQAMPFPVSPSISAICRPIATAS